MAIKTAMKRAYTGVSWQNPAMRAALPILDAADRRLRSRRHLEDLPAYSTRVRASGVAGEFGGRKYIRSGDRLVMSLIKYGGLSPTSQILEVGPGAGRVAYSVSQLLRDSGSYTGLDIDREFVEACEGIERLDSTRFRFVRADLQSDLYNPQGTVSADGYRFPFPDGSFDLVYMQSVFTHLLGPEAANYASEAMRVLGVGGRAVVSGFLTDHGTGASPFRFQNEVGSVWVEHSDNPRKAVAASIQSFESWFQKRPDVILRGTWRGCDSDYPGGQDWLVFEKNPSDVSSECPEAAAGAS